MRIRLILSFTIIVLVSVVSVVLIAQQSATKEVRLMFQGGRSGTEGLVGRLENYYTQNDGWDNVDVMLNEHIPGQSRGRTSASQGQARLQSAELRLADADGEIIADTTGTRLGDQMTLLERGEAIDLYHEDQLIGFLLPVNQSIYSSGDELQLVSAITRAAIIAGLLGAGLSLLLALFLAYQLLRPVQELTAAANSLAQGDLTQRVPVRGSDELSELGQSFNQMADSLERAVATRKAMTADIAHELRNPLAVQKAHLEALQDGIYALTPDNLTPILEQTQLLGRLVDDLRTLALADAGQLELTLTTTDMVSLTSRQLERFSPQADRRHIDLELVEGRNCPPIEVDPGRIAQILGNLLSNALRYTPEGGRVIVEITCSHANMLVKVHDSGPGIPLDSLAMVFERFYRADKSRSRLEGGTGLGLAIARQIARAHGGDLTASNHPDGGAVFTLRLDSPESA